MSYGKGWYFEPHRHSLAAKGISTSYGSKLTRNWAQIFPTLEERELQASEAPGGITLHEYWEAEARKILQKPTLTTDDFKALRDAFVYQFEAEISRKDYENITDYNRMIRDLAEAKANEAIKQHNEFFSGGGREKLLADVNERLADILDEAQLEPDLTKRQKIIDAELTALAASLRSTEEEIPLAFPKEEIKAQLAKIGPIVGKTPDEIMRLSPEIELPPLVKPLRFKELAPSPGEFAEERRLEKEEFWRSLTPEQIMELPGKGVIAEKIPRIKEIPIRVISEEKFLPPYGPGFQEYGPEFRTYGTPPPGLLPVYPKYYPTEPRSLAPSREQWEEQIRLIKAQAPAPLKIPAYLEVEKPRTIPFFTSRKVMKQQLPGIEQMRRYEKRLAEEKERAKEIGISEGV